MSRRSRSRRRRGPLVAHNFRWETFASAADTGPRTSPPTMTSTVSQGRRYVQRSRGREETMGRRTPIIGLFVLAGLVTIWGCSGQREQAGEVKDEAMLAGMKASDFKAADE